MATRSTSYYDVFYDKINNNVKLITVIVLVILVVLFLLFSLFFFIQTESGYQYRMLNYISGGLSAFFSLVSLLTAVYQWFFVNDVYQFFETDYMLNMPEGYVSSTTGDQLQGKIAVKRKQNSNIFIIDFDKVYTFGQLKVKPSDVMNREEIEVRMVKKNFDLFISPDFNFDAISKFYDRFANRVNQKRNEMKKTSPPSSPPVFVPPPEKKFFTRQQTTFDMSSVTSGGETNLFPL